MAKCSIITGLTKVYTSTTNRFTQTSANLAPVRLIEANPLRVYCKFWENSGNAIRIGPQVPAGFILPYTSGFFIEDMQFYLERNHALTMGEFWGSGFAGAVVINALEVLFTG